MTRAAASMPELPAAPASLVERWKALPWHYRLLTGFAAFFVAFQLWVYAIDPLADGWRERADRIEADLAEVARSSALVDQIVRKEDLIANLGRIAPPASVETVSTDLQRIAAEVADGRRSVADSKFSLGSPQRLPRTLSDAVLRTSRFQGRGGTEPRLVILPGDLSFTSTPEDAIAIIHELESMEEVETISVVRMVKEDGGRVSVSLTLESWAVELRRR